ncbi:MAG: glycine cleavage system protein T [Gammaproteobacteria bacterium]|nr:MAG: glycine cleavage system protein T [Gammaproteobacteria bacterium]
MTTEPFSPTLTIGPRVRKSPFFDATVRAGARAFTVYNHMYLPTGYSDPVSEYWSIVNEVSLWDVACERQVEITGPDALAFTQLLTPRDVSACLVDRCRYVVLTDEAGGIVNDAILLRLAEDHFWLSPGDSDVVLWAQGVAARSGMAVRVGEPDVSPLQLQGPKAPHVARKLFGDVAIDMGYFHMRQLELDGIPLVLSRTGWSGELGYELFLREGSRGVELWDKCMAAGAEFDIKPAAPSTIRSIEGAILSYGSDITRADNPWTVGLGRLVDVDKECDYIGKTALQKIAANGTSRRLVGVDIDGEPLAGNDAFWEVLAGGRVVGRVSRCVYSPRLEKNIGLVNVSVDCADVGERLTIETPGGLRGATVVPIPWITSETKIPEGI